MGSEPEYCEGRDILSRMTPADLLDIYKRVLLSCARRYGWSLKPLLEGFVEDAIADLYIGEWAYPPLDEEGKRKNVSLYRCLCWRVRNQVGRYFREHEKLIIIGGSGDTSLSDLWDYVVYEYSTGHFQSEEESDRECVYHELCEGIRRLAVGDQVLSAIVELLIKAPDIKPREIAAALGLAPRDVYRALRRLRRKVQDNLEQ